MTWHIIISWILIGTATATLVVRKWVTFDSDNGEHIFELVMVCLFWPIALTAYLINMLATMPESRRNHQKAKLAAQRTRELKSERHRTAIAHERALQAEAANREYQANGLPRIPE